jgi:hypothetical protein
MAYSPTVGNLESQANDMPQSPEEKPIFQNDNIPFLLRYVTLNFQFDLLIQRVSLKFFNTVRSSQLPR